jgi:superfamily II DNA/RNA helicase
MSYPAEPIRARQRVDFDSFARTSPTSGPVRGLPVGRVPTYSREIPAAPPVQQFPEEPAPVLPSYLRPATNYVPSRHNYTTDSTIHQQTRYAAAYQRQEASAPASYPRHNYAGDSSIHQEPRNEAAYQQRRESAPPSHPRHNYTIDDSTVHQQTRNAAAYQRQEAAPPSPPRHNYAGDSTIHQEPRNEAAYQQRREAAPPSHPRHNYAGDSAIHQEIRNAAAYQQRREAAPPASYPRHNYTTDDSTVHQQTRNAAAYQQRREAAAQPTSNENNSTSRNYRYDDRRSSNTELNGYQRADAYNSTNRQRAPKSYAPTARPIEEIFNEDTQEVHEHANTIFELDADIEVKGEIAPLFVERWEDMRLCPQILENIYKSEYVQPRKIQQFCVPYIQDQYSIRCQSETGSGKSAAFLIPLIDNLVKDSRRRALPTQDGPVSYPVCLIISPTRELTHQLYEQAKKFAYGTEITIAAAYGQYYDSRQNIADIQKGCNIICACLGRLTDLLELGAISLKYVRYLVIDEADRFVDNRDNPYASIEKILNNRELPDKTQRQTLLFSATLSNPELLEIADMHMDVHNQVFINAKAETNSRVIYEVLPVPSVPAKFRYLIEYLKEIKEKNHGRCPRTLVFVNRKDNVDRVALDITKHGFAATTIHSDRAQDLRHEALENFRSGKSVVLVATDVMARGVDIKNMDYVINFDLPDKRDVFVQRCGRTGRTHRGVAMSLYLPDSSDVNMASVIDDIITEAGQQSPQFLRTDVTAADYKYDQQPGPSTFTAGRRHETAYSQSSEDQHDSGYSRMTSPNVEQEEHRIPDRSVDDDWA